MAEAVSGKRAIEALRSGVPNRDAVRELGANQPAIAARFDDLLETASGDRPAGGVVVSGDFGSGKSHLLEYLEHVALDRSFVAGRVVISKETSLYDPGKVLRAALDAARVPDRRGDALSEIAERLSERGAAAYHELSDWVNGPASGLNERFAATLFLYENTEGDLELRDRIVRFWGGDPIGVAELKRELRDMGEGATWTFSRVSEKELALQRFRFIARLIRAAGYAGWVILFDEVELIGRYSLLQRARSYAEVARWADGRAGAGFAGIAAVLAKTRDFDSAVIQAKGDREGAPNRLRARGTEEDEELARWAERGIALLVTGLPLVPPDVEVLRQTYERLQQIHSDAYDWRAPPLAVERGESTRAMRQYVRAWIHEWDLRRLDPSYEPHIEMERIVTGYDEDPDFEAEEGRERSEDD